MIVTIKIMDLPDGDRKMLEHILVQNPSQLGQFEISFLNGRRDYLNDEQKRIFASVLKTPEQGHEEAVAAQAEVLVEPTQYTDEAGNAVTETVTPVVEPEVQVAPQENIVTAQTQTPASDVQETAPVAPTENTEAQVSEAPLQPEQPSQPLESTPEVVQEPVAPVEPAATNPEGAGEPTSTLDVNPYDVDTSEKDPDA